MRFSAYSECLYHLRNNCPVTEWKSKSHKCAKENKKVMLFSEQSVIHFICVCWKNYGK